MSISDISVPVSFSTCLQRQRTSEKYVSTGSFKPCRRDLILVSTLHLKVFNLNTFTNFTLKSSQFTGFVILNHCRRHSALGILRYSNSQWVWNPRTFELSLSFEYGCLRIQLIYFRILNSLRIRRYSAFRMLRYLNSQWVLVPNVFGFSVSFESKCLKILSEFWSQMSLDSFDMIFSDSKLAENSKTFCILGSTGHRVL